MELSKLSKLSGMLLDQHSRKVMESDLQYSLPQLLSTKRMTQPFILLDFRMLQIASVLLLCITKWCNNRTIDASELN